MPTPQKPGHRSRPRGSLAGVLFAGVLWLLETAFRRFFHRTRGRVRAGIQAPAPTMPPDVNFRSVARGHEVSDVSVGKIFGFGLGLSVCVLTVLGVALLYFRWLGGWERRSAADRLRHEPAAVTRVAAERDYTGPLLQVRPEEDLKALGKADAGELDSYGWLDRRAGVVRLPIERAMDLVAERGLPPVSPGKTAVQIQQERALPENRLDDRRQAPFAPAP